MFTLHLNHMVFVLKKKSNFLGLKVVWMGREVGRDNRQIDQLLVMFFSCWSEKIKKEFVSDRISCFKCVFSSRLRLIWFPFLLQFYSRNGRLRLDCLDTTHNWNRKRFKKEEDSGYTFHCISSNFNWMGKVFFSFSFFNESKRLWVSLESKANERPFITDESKKTRCC